MRSCSSFCSALCARGAARRAALAAVAAASGLVGGRAVAQHDPTESEVASASVDSSQRDTPGALAWLFPTSDEPARVQAGARLEVRVRLPTALTPPPGVQQSEALDRWGGALVAPARRWDAVGDDQVRYVLGVTDVRPDAGSTLGYRATLPLPAWVAPGAYTLSLATPGGTLGATPVIVWEPGAGLDPSRDSKAATATFVVVSGRVSVSIKDGVVTWYPAGALDSNEAPAVVGVLREASGQTATLRANEVRAFAPALRMPPDGRARAGEAVELAVEETGAGARVAWRIDERSVAWGPSAITHAFMRGGRQDVSAFVVAGDGRAALLRGSVNVEAAAGPGCAVWRPAAGDAAPAWVLACLAAVSKSARRRRGWNRLRRGCR